MEKKTHIMGANALALSIFQPKTTNELLITVGVTTFASIFPDIDLKDSTTDKLFDRLMVCLITIIITTMTLKYIFNLDLHSKLIPYSNIFKYIICTAFFIIMAYLGSKTPHRSFTHSFLGIIIYTFILSIGFNSKITTLFVIAYLSHIFLDIFNLKGMMLFYPRTKRISLKMCKSSSKANHILFIILTLLTILIILYISIN